MPGKIEKATHQDGTEFEGPVDTGNPHAKRPADKKQGDMNFDTAALKDKGKVFDSGKVAEQIEALFSGVEGLSEGFATKATVILEGALSEQVEAIKAALQEEYDAKVEAALTEATEGFADKIDSYMNYVVEQFMKENAVAIEQGIKNDIAEQVLTSVVAIVESNGITLPEDKVDVSEALAEEVKEMEGKLSAEIEKTLALESQLHKYQISEAFAELSAGMSDASKERLQKLAENISYKDVEDYKSRVNILKESLTETVKKPAAKADQQLNESVDVKVEDPKPTNDRMAAYLAAIRD